MQKFWKKMSENKKLSLLCNKQRKKLCKFLMNKRENELIYLGKERKNLKKTKHNIKKIMNRIEQEEPEKKVKKECEKS